MRYRVGVAMALMAAAPAPAMTVQAFLDKADALKAKGMMALFSPDIGVLKNEFMAADKGWRDQAATARPPVCPPPKGAKIDSDQILAMLRAIPPGERTRLSVADGLNRQMNARYRCP